MFNQQDIEALQHVLSRTPLTPPEFLWVNDFIGRLSQVAAMLEQPLEPVINKSGGPSEVTDEDLE